MDIIDLGVDIIDLGMEFSARAVDTLRHGMDILDLGMEFSACAAIFRAGVVDVLRCSADAARGREGPRRVVMAFAGGSRYIPPVQADEWLDAGLRGPVVAEVARCGGGALAGRGLRADGGGAGALAGSRPSPGWPNEKGGYKV